MPAYELQPVDTLFFRDGRPMDAGGHGAAWPLPTITHEALRAALLRNTGELPTGKHTVHHKTGKNGAREKYVASDLFRSLRTIGPFPVLDSQIYFPRPSDVVPAGKADTDANAKPVVVCLAPINQQSLPQGARTNLPADWLSPVSSQAPPSKAKLPQWVTADWLKTYLAHANGKQLEIEDYDQRLYQTEHRIGIEIDRDTHTAKDTKFYTTEHLRLSANTRLWIDARLNENDKKPADIQTTLDDLAHSTITLGGESRVCHVISGANYNLAKLVPPPELTEQEGGILIKWALVTPAVFNNGWRPNWIDEKTGAVLLKKGDLARNGADRKTWRERIRQSPTIHAQLKAVCMPKPIFFSGWDVNLENNGKITGGPKPTVMAAASGTVFYLACETLEDAQALVQALHGRTQSDCFGEKGLGLGFCGNWQYLY